MRVSSTYGLIKAVGTLEASATREAALTVTFWQVEGRKEGTFIIIEILEGTTHPRSMSVPNTKARTTTNLASVLSYLTEVRT